MFFPFCAKYYLVRLHLNIPGMSIAYLTKGIGSIIVDKLVSGAYNMGDKSKYLSPFLTYTSASLSKVANEIIE